MSLLDRRRFLQSSVAFSAAASAGMALADGSGSLPPDGYFQLDRFVVDLDLDDGVAVSRAARRAGLEVSEVRGDMSRLWYDDLDYAWRKSPMVLPGVTAPEGLFVLETLALDRGMRVMYRGEHGPSADQDEFHQLRGPRQVVAPILECLAASATADATGAAIVQALMRCPIGRQPTDTARAGNRMTGAAAVTAADRELVTWLIAPKTLGTAVAAA